MSSFSRALVIMNPSSGQHDPDITRSTVHARMEQEGLRYELRVTAAQGDALQWAETASAEDFDLVIAAGGDGTIMEAMSGLIRSGSDVPLLQLPAGTANLLARALTIPTELDEALDLIVAGRVERLDVGYLPRQDRYFALVAGCGYDARLIADATRELKNVLGFAAYIVTGVKNLFNLRRSHIELTVDGRRRSLRANTIMIVNVGEIGDAGVKLGPNVSPHDGKLDVVIATPASFIGALSILLRILTGRFEGHNDLTYLSVDHVVVDAKPPLPTEIDGEALGMTPLEVQAVPGGALLVVPPSYQPFGNSPPQRQ